MKDIQGDISKGWFVRIRKTTGLLPTLERTAYTFTAGESLVAFDSIAEMEDADEGGDRGRAPRRSAMGDADGE